MNNIDTLISYKRINIVGSPGSGKSTVANKLGKLLNLNVYDLDDYLYDKSCKRLNSDLSTKALDELLKKSSFIIDGTYTTTFRQRLKYLDLVILTDRDTLNNIVTFFIRLITKKTLKCGERLTFKTSLLLLKFNARIKPSLISTTIDQRVKLAIYKRKIDELQWVN